MGSRVELFAVIRRDARVEDLSIRELADRHHVHRRTVRQALASALPPARKTPVRVSRKLEPFKADRSTAGCVTTWTHRESNDTPRSGCSTGCVDEHSAAGRVVLDGAGLRGQAPPGDRR